MWRRKGAVDRAVAALNRAVAALNRLLPPDIGSVAIQGGSRPIGIFCRVEQFSTAISRTTALFRPPYIPPPTACIPLATQKKTTTYILRVVPITTRTHDRRKSNGRRNKENIAKERKGKERKGKERKEKERKKKGKERKGNKRKEEERKEKKAKKGKRKEKYIF